MYLVYWVIGKFYPRRTIANVLERVNDVYSTLSILVRETGAFSATIKRIEYAKDTSLAGHDLYATVVYEVASSNKGMKMRWRNKPVDEEHIALLVDLYKKGRKTVHTKKLCTSSMKEEFQKEGIVSTEKRILAVDENYLFYLSMHYDKYINTTPHVESVIQDSVNKLKVLISPKY